MSCLLTLNSTLAEANIVSLDWVWRRVPLQRVDDMVDPLLDPLSCPIDGLSPVVGEECVATDHSFTQGKSIATSR